MSWWEAAPPSAHPSSGFLSRAHSPQLAGVSEHSLGPRCQTPSLGVGCLLVSPPPQSGEGLEWGAGGSSHIPGCYSGPWGRGLGCHGDGELSWGGGTACLFHPLLSHPVYSVGE